MYNVKLFTILLTCAANLEYLSFAMARSSSNSMHRLIKRSLNEEGCGIKEDVENSEQIMGGEQSSEKWPWMASLSHNGGNPYCGGSVLDKRHVITAGHCFEGESDNPEEYTVAVGQMELGQGEQFKVEKIIVHEEYRGAPNYPNDIALLILESELPEDVVPICLPEEDEIGDTDAFTIIGFGVTEDGGGLSDTLQEIDQIPYVNTDRCNSIIQEYSGMNIGITEKQLCTGDDEGGRLACQGDSGGPVMHQQPDKSWSLVGMVSFGLGCFTSSGIPVMHTRIHAYRDWIEMHMVEEEGE